MSRLSALLSRGEEAWYSESIGGHKSTGTFRLQRRLPLRDHLYLIALILCAVTITIMQWEPIITLMPLIVLGGILLRIRDFIFLVAVALIGITYTTIQTGFVPGETFAVVASMGIALLLAHPRTVTGVRGFRGAAMLSELHTRLEPHRMPKPPKGWGAKSLVRQPHGALGGGDFIVSHRCGPHLELALASVSGEGVHAAMGAITLNGAFNGLLDSVPHQEFLNACNRYVNRYELHDGFVSSIRLSVDFNTGNYMLSCAGNPAPVKLNSSSGSWQELPVKGVALGIKKDAEYGFHAGMLARGEALMLFTDGLTAGRDVDERTDRLLGEADCLLSMGLGAGATHLIRGLSRASRDDGALVVLWRS